MPFAVDNYYFSIAPYYNITIILKQFKCQLYIHARVHIELGIPSHYIIFDEHRSINNMDFY